MNSANVSHHMRFVSTELRVWTVDISASINWDFQICRPNVTL